MKFYFFAIIGAILFFGVNLGFAQTNYQTSEPTASATHKIAPIYYFVNDALTNESQVKKILRNPEKWVRKIKIMTQTRFAKTYKLKLDGNALMIYTKGRDWEAKLTAP